MRELKSLYKLPLLVLLLALSGACFNALRANDISLPSYPVDPGYPQGPQTNEAKKNQTTTNTVKVEIIAVLGTTDEVRGYILLPDRISFKHYKNGLVYDKNITPDDLQSISIQEYSKEDDGKKTKETFYTFEPSAIEIKLKDNTSYRINKIFSFLKSFSIDTNNGRTKLYTIFGDSYEKSKGWRDAESKDPDYHRNRPHPASVKKIIFIKVDRES
jgi:hypothetical protein